MKFRQTSIRLVLIGVLGSCAGLISCSGKASNEDRKPKNENVEPLIYVVNYPLQYFAERIGGDWIDVKFPAPRDEDPAFWNPTAEIIGEFQRADLILINGASYAKWIDRTTLPESRIVDTTFAIKAWGFGGFRKFETVGKFNAIFIFSG